jgi:hypothetical protein
MRLEFISNKKCDRFKIDLSHFFVIQNNEDICLPFAIPPQPIIPTLVFSDFFHTSILQ